MRLCLSGRKIKALSLPFRFWPKGRVGWVCDLCAWRGSIWCRRGCRAFLTMPGRRGKARKHIRNNFWNLRVFTWVRFFCCATIWLSWRLPLPFPEWSCSIVHSRTHCPQWQYRCFPKNRQRWDEVVAWLIWWASRGFPSFCFRNLIRFCCRWRAAGFEISIEGQDAWWPFGGPSWFGRFWTSSKRTARPQPAD
jgi:hypothetical protein